jgi:hypothetical protein
MTRAYDDYIVMFCKPHELYSSGFHFGPEARFCLKVIDFSRTFRYPALVLCALEETHMFKRGLVLLLLLGFALPVVASTHKDTFNVPCKTLWQAVRDTLRNSGKYGIIGINGEEMTASYNMGGNITGKRVNSVLLNAKGDNACELQVQTAFSGLVNNDYGDFKERVTKSLAKVQAAAPPAKPTADVEKEDKTAGAATPTSEEKK